MTQSAQAIVGERGVDLGRVGVGRVGRANGGKVRSHDPARLRLKEPDIAVLVARPWQSESLQPVPVAPGPARACCASAVPCSVPRALQARRASRTTNRLTPS